MANNNDIQPALFKRLMRWTWLARAFLIWETYAAILAPAMLAVALFSAAAFLGIWERIGDPWRGIALIISLFFIARSLRRALSLRFPTQSDSRRRLERDSGQSHRPLDTLDDKPALSVQAWPAHYKKALSQAKAIRRPQRRSVLGPIDKYFLRFGAPLILAAAMIYSAGFGFERIKNAVKPSWQSAINPAKVSFEAWIDPPQYTGRPPIYFKDKADVIIPAGSELVMRLSGTKDAPRPKLWQKSRTRFLSLKRLGPKSFEARVLISSSGKAEWRVGTQRKIWTLNTEADMPPDVEFVDPPKADKRDRLVFSYQLEDDYGVETLRLEMAQIIDGVDEVDTFNSKLAFADVPLSGGSIKKTDKSGAVLDLTKHIWAGEKVIGRLIAIDGAGKQARSEPAYFTVPDKIFVEPLAKAAAEQRQLILSAKGQDYAPSVPRTGAMGYFNTYEPELRLDRAPASIQRAALLIDAVTDRPDELFQDPAIYMGLRHIHQRLRYARNMDELGGIDEDLWKIALRAEFGTLGTALEEMREAEERLRVGMARRAPEREISTLFERYDLSVENYTEELRRKALEEGDVRQAGGGGGGSMESVDEIQELLKAIEDANKAGDTEGARRALARLAEILENMKIQLTQGPGGGDGDGFGGEMSEEMKKSLEELADMMGEQRELQDETRQSERDSADGQNDGSLSPQELAQQQSDLQEVLEAFRKAIDDELENTQSGGQEGDQNGSGSGEQAGTEGEGADEGESSGGENSDGEGGGSQSAENGNQSGSQNGSEAGSKSGAEGGSGLSIADLMDKVRRSMNDSESNLRAGELGQARRDQAEVMQDLRELGEKLAEIAAEQSGQGETNGEGQDPLGRSAEGGVNSENSDADLDMKNNAERSREILEELRRRAAEQNRKKQEREYLERLLKQF